MATVNILFTLMLIWITEPLRPLGLILYKLPLLVFKCFMGTLRKRFALTRCTMLFGRNGMHFQNVSIGNGKSLMFPSIHSDQNSSNQPTFSIRFKVEPILTEYGIFTLFEQATKNPFYLRVGEAIVESLNKYALAPCGYATLHDVIDKSQEDRMESFFLSETCKYLYLVINIWLKNWVVFFTWLLVLLAIRYPPSNQQNGRTILVYYWRTCYSH